MPNNHLYPSNLASQYVDQDQDALLRQLTSIPGLQDRLAQLFQISNASKTAKDPSQYRNAAYNAGLQPGPMGEDDLTFLSAKIAEHNNPNFNASVGRDNARKMFPEVFQNPLFYQHQPSQLAWGPDDYVEQLRQRALGQQVSGYGPLNNQRVVPPSRLQ